MTGAFGFAGANLVEHLLEQGFRVYAIGRKESSHNDRFEANEMLKTVLLPMDEYDRLWEIISDDCRGAYVTFFNLAWGGGRDDHKAQLGNIDGAIRLMDSAIALKKISQSVKFVGIGSQAEYGVKSDDVEITEDMSLDPFSAYGSCKAAAYYLLKNKAKLAEIYFVWGRIFSLIGKYEPSGRMLPDLVQKLRDGQDIYLSSCEQYWDYLDAEDAADAIIALGERGHDGEAYNIADGRYKKLREFVEEVAKYLSADIDKIHFGERAKPFVSLRPSVSKIQKDTLWRATTPFLKSIDKY